MTTQPASSPNRPLTVAELIEHPEYPYATWGLRPAATGRCPVARSRGGPIHIAYELHGHGPRKLVFVMGLGALKTSWQRQTKDFGYAQPDKYSVLVMDNRGIGESDKPLMRYSTSEMARDTIEVLQHVGWLPADVSQAAAAVQADMSMGLNIIGISMGGMIAQEMALILPPGTINSLNLVSTAARLVNTVGFVQNLRDRIQLFIPKSVDTQIAHMKETMFAATSLERADDAYADEVAVQRYPTIGDRIAAFEVQKRRGGTRKFEDGTEVRVGGPDAFTRTGFICQAIAAGWHYKSVEQLQEIAQRVGRGRIVVMHGVLDRMITFFHGQALAEGLKREQGEQGEDVRTEWFEHAGHVIPIEFREEFKRIVSEMVERGERRWREEKVRGSA